MKYVSLDKKTRTERYIRHGIVRLYHTLLDESTRSDWPDELNPELQEMLKSCKEEYEDCKKLFPPDKHDRVQWSFRQNWSGYGLAKLVDEAQLPSHLRHAYIMYCYSAHLSSVSQWQYINEETGAFGPVHDVAEVPSLLVFGAQWYSYLLELVIDDFGLDLTDSLQRLREKAKSFPVPPHLE